MVSKSESQKSMEKVQGKISVSLKRVDHKIAIMSGKGGVGKSTVSANLATIFSVNGKKVGLVDCDMHGPSIPRILGLQGERPSNDGDSIVPIETETGLQVISIGSILPEEDSPVVWRGPLKMKAIQQFLSDVNWHDLDYLFFDLPPGTGDEPLSLAQLIPDSDGTIVVTTPQEVALQTIRRAVNFAREVGLNVLGIIENMSGFVCPNCKERIDIFTSGGGMDLASELGIPFLGKVPLDPEIVKSGERGRPFVLDNEIESAKIFKDIMNDVKEAVI